VNAAAGHLRGAYRLQDERYSDYSLLPIQVWGCHDTVPFKSFQVRAAKKGSTDWFSPLFQLQKLPAPDQVTDLKASRSEEDPGIIHVSWKQSNNEYSEVAGAFAIAGKSNFNDRLASRYVKGDKTSTALVVGPLPVNVTVVRYNNGGNMALSYLENTPQITI
jgi:hypothetical protein